MHVIGRPARAAASLGGIAVLVAGVPALLVAAARARFGGDAPWHGVDAPPRWSFDRIWTMLGTRLDDEILLDAVVRIAIGVAWIAVAVVATTIVAETVHMARHGGLALPAVRGLGWSQRIARTIAVGLLVLTPLTSMTRAQARSTSMLTPRGSVVPTVVQSIASDPMPAGDTATSDDAPALNAPVRYVVVPGDSVYRIAGRVAAGDPALARS
jgi:hypothetical protein